LAYFAEPLTMPLSFISQGSKQLSLLTLFTRASSSKGNEIVMFSTGLPLSQQCGVGNNNICIAVLRTLPVPYLGHAPDRMA
jgi:hypothetical protein